MTSVSNGMTSGLSNGVDSSLLQQHLFKAQMQSIIEQQQRLAAMSMAAEQRERAVSFTLPTSLPTSNAMSSPCTFMPPTSSPMTDADRQLQLQQYLSQMPSPLALLRQCQPVVSDTVVCRE